MEQTLTITLPNGAVVRRVGKRLEIISTPPKPAGAEPEPKPGDNDRHYTLEELWHILRIR